MLWDLFDGQLDGTYVEVGAFDGQTFSVSWLFEAIGWSGLLVEATPQRYEQCKASRPNSRVVHAALSKRGSSGTTKFTVVEGAAGDVLSYLGTTDEHRNRVQREGGRAVEVEVSLTTYLLSNRINLASTGPSSTSRAASRTCSTASILNDIDHAC